MEHMNFAFNFQMTQSTAAELRACCRELDRRGWHSAWFAEGRARDAVTGATLALAESERLRVGTAILPVATRSPLLLAMTAQTLSDLFNNRFILGLGASTKTMVHHWHGMPYDPAPSSLVATTQLVRAFLKGERQSLTEGRYAGMQGASLGHITGASIPIIWATLGPKSIALASEHAAGFLLNLPTVEYVRAQIDRIDPARRSSLMKMANIACTFAADPEPERAAFRRYLANYGAAPAYNRYFAWMGFVDEAAGMRAAWAQRDGKGALAAVSDAMIDELLPAGERAVRRRVEAFSAAGLDVGLFVVFGSGLLESIDYLDRMRAAQ